MRNSNNPRQRTKRKTDPQPARKRYAAVHGVTRRQPRGGGDGSVVEPPELDQGDELETAERAPTIPPAAPTEGE